MKASIKLAILAICMIPCVAFSQKIKNVKTDTVNISGNCDMCKRTIEKAGNVKSIAQVDWDKTTKSAILIYNGEKTDKDEILKRIALAGYDNEMHLAPDNVYEKLHHCCQYERVKKVKKVKTATAKMDGNGR